MIDQLKRCWIGLLVIVLVSLHGAIVAMIRMEAAQAKSNASCEVDLGRYVVRGTESVGPMQLQVHALAPINLRMQSRRLIELNQFQVRQSIEEYLRQAPAELFMDPVLADLKVNLMDILIQACGKASIDDVLVTDVRPVNEQHQWTYTEPSHREKTKIVITRRESIESIRADADAKLAAEAAAHAADAHGGHGDAHGDAGHGDAGHGDAGHGDAGHGDSHGDSGHGDAHGDASHGDEHGDASHGDAGHDEHASEDHSAHH
jgi:hypothetical protein